MTQNQRARLPMGGATQQEGDVMKHRKWSCLRCSGKEYDVGEIRAAGGAWSRVFNVQNRKFSTVSCEKCGFTELYKADATRLGDVFDFFVG
jgi:predicted nucleic-acid-binding Zn-ribbon protein